MSLPKRLLRSDVVVLTPADLSQPGWCYRPGSGASVIAAQGEVFDSSEVAAVITRLPWISHVDLQHIVTSDRDYVAAEMSAFLVAWLTELACPVANRPHPNCLCGPFWRHERWVFEAARASIAVEPARRAANADGGEYLPSNYHSQSSVTVVGRRGFGDPDEQLREQALRLARATGVETLTVNYADSGSGMRFFTANPWPCLEDDAIADALLEHLAAPMEAIR